jgi:hypothetical protein
MVEWLWCAVGAIALLGFTLNFYKDHMREQPVPSETYAKETDCRARHAEDKGEISLLRVHCQKIHEREEISAAERRKGIYDMIRATEEKLSANMILMRQESRDDLKEVTGCFDQKFTTLQDQIKNAPAETVALLRQTKGLL